MVRNANFCPGLLLLFLTFSCNPESSKQVEVPVSATEAKGTSVKELSE